MTRVQQRRWLLMRKKSRDERIALIVKHIRGKASAPTEWYR